MADLQTDYYSKPASLIVPLLSDLQLDEFAEYRDLLLDWNFSLDAESIASGIYVTWERKLRDSISKLVIPDEASKYLSNISMEKTIELLYNPSFKFGKSPEVGRDRFVEQTFIDAIHMLTETFGTDKTNWKYGQTDFKHIQLKHALDPLLTEDERRQFNTDVIPRGGYSYTLNNTSGNNLQTHGASFRIIVDTGNFDKSLGCNSPGQSGVDDTILKFLFIKRTV